MTAAERLHVLAIVNGDPTSNAGARLRVRNWVDALPADAGLEVRVERRPRLARHLFALVREWRRSLPPVHDPGPGRRSNQVVIVQKAFSLEMVALLLHLRLLGIAVIQDICDPPLKVFNPEPFSKPFFAVFYLSLVSHYLVDQITVSSSVLERSFAASASPVTYIPDCIDFETPPPAASLPAPVLSFPCRPDTADHHHLPPLHLLWFGGAARPGTRAGIEELYAATPLLRDLASRHRVCLSVCTILEPDTLPIFQEWATRSHFIAIAYYRWSLPVQERLLNDCDLCFLPRLQSLATFYKSPNRIVLAARHGRRSLSNLIPSEDYAALPLLLPADLPAAPAGATHPPLPFPAAWTSPNIVREWRQAIHAARQRRALRPQSRLHERIGLQILLWLLIATLAAIDFRKSFWHSLRNRTPMRQLRSTLSSP